MQFQKNKLIEILGERAGYLFTYFLLTTVLFFILTALNKIPKSWSYFHIMAITVLIALIGAVIKGLLK